MRGETSLLCDGSVFAKEKEAAAEAAAELREREKSPQKLTPGLV